MHSKTNIHHIKYRADIDGLRAIAVTLVVIYHAFPALVPSGFIGVDIFFVISGYLISQIIVKELNKNTFSISNFYSRRIRRIFPSLLLVLAACLLFGWAFLLADEFKQLGKHVSSAAIFTSNLTLWQESGYFDKTSETKPLLHLWSLGVEEQFYLLWPIILIITLKQKLKINYVITFFALLFFSFNIYLTHTSPSSAFYLPHSRFWELMLGALVAVNQPIIEKTFNTQGVFSKNKLSIFGASLVALGLIIINNDMKFPGWLGLLPTMGASLIIAAGPTSWINKQILSNKLLVWIGLISFPLYLWHWPLLFSLQTMGENNSNYARLLTIIISIALAWMSYKFFEQFIKNTNYRKATTTTLVVMIIFAGLIGNSINKEDGYKSRYQSALLQNFPSDLKTMYQPVDYKFRENIRSSSCHIEEDSAIQRPDFCTEKKQPLIAIWGDSFAAALYQGISDLQQTRIFGVSQLTAGFCPPISGANKYTIRKDCEEVNAFTIAELAKSQPDVLIMHAGWFLYQNSNSSISSSLKEEILKIKSTLKNTKIIVIGPTPRWEGSPQRTAYLYWRRAENKPTSIPIRLPAQISTDIDVSLGAAMNSIGVKYVSPLNIFCEGDQCISRTSDDPLDFIAADAIHLSKSGAKYLAISIVNDIF